MVVRPCRHNLFEAFLICKIKMYIVIILLGVLLNYSSLGQLCNC